MVASRAKAGGAPPGRLLSNSPLQTPELTAMVAPASLHGSSSSTASAASSMRGHISGTGSVLVEDNSHQNGEGHPSMLLSESASTAMPTTMDAVEEDYLVEDTEAESGADTRATATVNATAKVDDSKRMLQRGGISSDPALSAVVSSPDQRDLVKVAETLTCLRRVAASATAGGTGATATTASDPAADLPSSGTAGQQTDNLATPSPLMPGTVSPRTPASASSASASSTTVEAAASETSPSMYYTLMTPPKSHDAEVADLQRAVDDMQRRHQAGDFNLHNSNDGNNQEQQPFDSHHDQQFHSQQRQQQQPLHHDKPVKPDGTPLFKCPYETCQHVFGQATHLNVHLRRHTGERPYVCSHCNKAFTQLGNLKTHERTHTNEKPFKCDHCGKAFAQLGNLRTHIFTHSGQKPFVCRIDDCNKAFTQLGNCKSHQCKYHGLPHGTSVENTHYQVLHGNKASRVLDMSTACADELPATPPPMPMPVSMTTSSELLSPPSIISDAVHGDDNGSHNHHFQHHHMHDEGTVSDTAKRQRVA